MRQGKSNFIFSETWNWQNITSICEAHRNKNGISAIRFAPFSCSNLQIQHGTLVHLSTACVSSEQSHFHAGNGSAVAGTVLSSSTEFGTQTSRPNQTKIPKTYRKCLQRWHTILHLLLFYCFTCCWDSSIFIYTINSDWRGTLALLWSCIGVSTLFFHELFTGIQWCVMKYSDYLNHSSWEWQRYLLICLLKSRTCHSAQSVFLVQNASLPFCLPFPAMHMEKNLHGKCCLLLFLFGMYSFISAGPGAEASFWLDKHCASPSKIKVSRLILCLEPMRVFTQLCLDM